MAGRSIALNSWIEVHRAEIRALLEPHNARSIAVFGSVARGEATVDSDVDISLGPLLERDDEIRFDAVRL